MRYAAIFQQADDRGDVHRDPGRMHAVAILFFHHGDTLEHQDDGAAGSTDVDRFVGRVQHQHGRVHWRALNAFFRRNAGVVHVSGQRLVA